MIDEKLLTVEEVAEQLRVHPESIRRWLRSGALKGFQLPGNAGYRVSAADLVDFIRRKREGLVSD